MGMFGKYEMVIVMYINVEDRERIKNNGEVF